MTVTELLGIDELQLDGIISRLTPAERRDLEVKLDAYERRRQSSVYAQRMAEEMAHASESDPFAASDALPPLTTGWYVCFKGAEVGIVRIPKYCLKPSYDSAEEAEIAMDDIAIRMHNISDSISKSDYEIHFMTPSGVEKYERRNTKPAAPLKIAIGQ